MFVCSPLLMPALLKRPALPQKRRHLLKLPRKCALAFGCKDAVLAVMVAHFGCIQAEAERAEVRRLDEARRAAEAAAKVCVYIYVCLHVCSCVCMRFLNLFSCFVRCNCMQAEAERAEARRLEEARRAAEAAAKARVRAHQMIAL